MFADLERRTRGMVASMDKRSAIKLLQKQQAEYRLELANGVNDQFLNVM
jgi:hypothetical protein